MQHTLTAEEERLANAAELKFGVRPKTFHNGRPVFTPDEMRDPRFKWPYPPEPGCEAEWKAFEAQKNA